MNGYAEAQPPLQILVFLPETAASRIAGKLNEHGYIAGQISSPLDLEDALLSDHYSLVVTTRPNIDIVRQIKPLPVINLEIFFHPAQSADVLDAGPKQFDLKAFFQRIEALNAYRSPRVTTPAVSRRRSYAGAMTTKLAVRMCAMLNCPA
jgi:hypothetical protein